MDGRQLTVYEHWEAVGPTQRKQLEDVLRRNLPALNAIHGVTSVEFAELRTQPGRYLALFRYADEGVRSAFLRSEPVQRLRAEAEPLWTRVSESVWSFGV
jgi:quinol monooxygenase YgiN